MKAAPESFVNMELLIELILYARVLLLSKVAKAFCFAKATPLKILFVLAEVILVLSINI